MIELLVVDDHTIFRAGIARLMSDEPDIRVTGEAADSGSAMAMVRSNHYDVVLMDINLGARNGLETLATIRAEFPRLPVIMLSMYVEAQYAKLAMKARANAYLTKDVGTAELLEAIRRVSTGGLYVSQSMGAALSGGRSDAADSPAHQALTAREMQIMQKIARGVPLTEIGVQMCVSVKTVSSHRAHILDKLGIASNAELVQYAIRNGLVD